MEPIKDTITQVMRELLTGKTSQRAAGPEEVFKKILTKKELRHIKVSNFKKGVLVVNVDSSAWLYSLSLQKEGLLSRLEKKAGPVKDIHFRLGEIK